MTFKMAHCNINVIDLERSEQFYSKALGLSPLRRKQAEDGSFSLAFLGNEATDFQLELTWLRDKKGSYELGDNESHIAFIADDITAAHALHEKMGCICHENKSMGIYFIEDPDGYWIEILPKR